MTAIIEYNYRKFGQDTNVKHYFTINNCLFPIHMTLLLVVLEIWSDMLDDGDPVDAIYVDFRKAFDSVPHQRLLSSSGKRLLNKLKAYGINGQITKWIRTINMGRSDLGHTTDQCLGTHPICPVHK